MVSRKRRNKEKRKNKKRRRMMKRKMKAKKKISIKKTSENGLRRQGTFTETPDSRRQLLLTTLNYS